MSTEVSHVINISDYQTQFLTPQTNHLLLDVREADEYENGHIPGAVNIPLSELQNRLSEVDREKPIVVVCARGGRSAMAIEFMTANDFDGLYNLSDGTMGWVEQGLPTERP